MKVECLEGEPWRFMVESRDPDRAWPYFAYLVDLEEHNGHGECACEHWQFSPAGHKPACAHILAAREAALQRHRDNLTWDQLYAIHHPPTKSAAKDESSPV